MVDTNVWMGLLPKEETQAHEFLLNHPDWDGRGIVVGILDTGVDPGAIGLSRTSDGKVKVIDLVDCSGSNDVIMGPLIAASEDGYLPGDTGRKIKINPSWKNPQKLFRVSHKRAYDLLPKILVDRIKTQRKEKWAEKTKSLEAEEMDKLLNSTDILKEDIKLRLTQLRSIGDEFEDPGPVFDCVVFHDGENWQAVIDETGDMSALQPMTDYRKFFEYKCMSTIGNMNYAVNIFDNGDILSIVTDCGDHGTHVAGILSAYHPDQPECNGVAPGAQIISLKIGDSRLGSMETGPSLIRALIEAVKRGCNIINISYGEAVAWDNYGDVVNLVNELVREHGVIVVSSAGNNGPALSTCGCPGATSASAIGVAALCTNSLMKVAYAYSSSLPTANYTWSSVGPTIDGDLGVNITAPGAAVTCIPNWTLEKKSLKNGTSMSSPNCTGCITLVLSAAKASGIYVNPTIIRRAIESSAKYLDGVPLPSQGSGLIQVVSAWEHLQMLSVRAQAPSSWVDVPVSINVMSERFSRGIYLRQPHETSVANTFKVELLPFFSKKISPETKINFELRLKLVSTASWIQTCDQTVLCSTGKTISVAVDPSGLSCGLHTEFVRIYVDGDEFLGPLCSIPVNVTKPVVIPQGTNQYSLGNMFFPEGNTIRTFIVPPKGCQYVDAIIKDTRSLGEDGQLNSSTTTLVVHAVQLFKGTPYRDNEKDAYVQLEPSSVHTLSWAVTDSWTMELVLARSWATVLPTSCEVTLNFHGVEPKPSQVTISGGSRVSPMIRLFSYIRDSDISPSGKLDKWISLLKPTEPGKVLPLGERDVLLDGSKMYQLILEYDFEITEDKKASVVPRWPGLQGVLYESDFNGQLFFIYDSNKNVISVGDAWPSYASLSKGEYKIRLQVRHRSTQVLENLASLPALLERKINSPINLSFCRMQSEALTSNESFKSKRITVDSMLSLYIREPSVDNLPKGVKAGDILLGTVTFLKKQDGIAGAGMRPGGYSVKYYVSDVKSATKPSKAPTKSVKKTETSIDEVVVQAVKSAKLDFLKSKVGSEAFMPLFESLVNEYTIESQLRELATEHSNKIYQAFLDKAKNINAPLRFNSKEVFVSQATLDEGIKVMNSIMSITDIVIGSLDLNTIAMALCTGVDTDDSTQVEAKAAAESGQQLLIKTASIRSHILLVNYYLAKNTSLNCASNTETSLELKIKLKQAIKALQKWDDISKDAYWQLHVYELESSGKLGEALKKVTGLISSPAVDKDLIVQEQLSLLEALKWSHVISVAEILASLRQKAQFRPF